MRFLQDKLRLEIGEESGKREARCTAPAARLMTYMAFRQRARVWMGMMEVRVPCDIGWRIGKKRAGWLGGVEWVIPPFCRFSV